MVAGSRAVLGFTGAGISTECGVPDFRSPGSPWRVNSPIPFDLFMASEEARCEAWRRKFAMDDLYGHATPGRGHRALAGLVAAGRMPAIVTQNIDGLHQAAGVPADKVVELHGNGTYATCLDCGTRHELADVRWRFEASGRAPTCRSCGGVVKSATVSFGQAMPEQAMRRATRLALACDLVVAVGSSLVVHPAAEFPLLAKRNGARLVIVNAEPTPLDGVADLVINADIGTVLAPLSAVV
ncbi:Sir2 family NAD-dependent protein deacetylase [Chelatococcus sp. SYSU_G07232]|uniref:protein acetyllysine N-acetyltransferase n=1 Tax=Chelatococcus albus TaxID=3047466 RepID=A0ABT7ACE6_9HYPH|nr:Sir2 family NAD-dependent protein deacetylase [Chelatococcus sp. SYSU_G07232]MDJ1157041.1 Sir2 family NAD-dependent protein deacetylase [Chelatococcus sp. SYSU_G07232]